MNGIKSRDERKERVHRLMTSENEPGSDGTVDGGEVLLDEGVLL